MCACVLYSNRSGLSHTPVIYTVKVQTRKRNKTNVTPEKDGMTFANQTPGGYKFVPLVASQQWRANQHESACFGLSSRWSFPSLSGIRLHAVVQPWLSLQRSISSWNVPRPLFRRPAPFPLVLGCSRPLVGADAESSEVVQTLFLGPQHSPRRPPILRTSGTSFGSLVLIILHYYTTTVTNSRWTSSLSSSRCKSSTLTTRQPMVELYSLAFPRFPLRKKEHKSYFGKNRTHDFRTSRCAGYLLDHSGDDFGPLVVHEMRYLSAS